MKLKCTKGQFEALQYLFKTIMTSKPEDIAASMVKDLMEPIFKKINRRLDGRGIDKRSWNICLTPTQAKAYYTFFNEMNFGRAWQYEGIIIQRHLDEIERVYA